MVARLSAVESLSTVAHAGHAPPLSRRKSRRGSMGLPSCVGLLQLRVQITRPNEPLSRFMPREQPPPSEDAHEPSGGRSPLRPDQRETADELRALDPHLAGLYEHALELLPRIR